MPLIFSRINLPIKPDTETFVIKCLRRHLAVIFCRHVFRDVLANGTIERSEIPHQARVRVKQVVRFYVTSEDTNSKSRSFMRLFVEYNKLVHSIWDVLLLIQFISSIKLHSYQQFNVFFLFYSFRTKCVLNMMVIIVQSQNKSYHRAIGNLWPVFIVL